MGNELTKCCGKVDINQEDTDQIYFEKAKSKPKSPSQNPAVVIQTFFRRCLAIEKLNKMIRTFQREYFENIGRSVDIEEIKQRRGKVLSNIEESFKENHAEGIELKKYFQDALNDNTSKSKHKNIFVPNLLISSKEIYDGYWELEHNQGVFSYNCKGYGNLYLEDGTKLEGIFAGDTIINKGVIYHNNGKIYVGEIRTINDEGITKYKEHGQGCLYHFTDKLLKHTIKGRWIEGNLTGNCIVDNIDKFTLCCEFKDGNINYEKGKLNYSDGTSYEGEFNNHFHKHGQGKVLYSNGHSYEGCWKKDKYHGAGLLFKTDNDLESIMIAVEENNYQKNKNSSSKATFIQAIWIEGLLHGKGLVTVNNKVTENFWRYGKLIHVISKLGSNRIILNDNIFAFLNFQEKLELMKLHNKNILTGITNNNEFKLKLKLLKMGSSDIEDYPFLKKRQIKHKKPASYFNQYILDNLKSLTNLNDIIDNYTRKISNFLPIVAYFTNGGLIQKRLHYSNTFTPDLKRAFSSNYLYQKKNDILVRGVLCASMYEANRTKDIKEDIENANRLDNMLNNAREYLPQFEELKQEYKYDLNKFNVTDMNVLNKCLDGKGDYLFTLDNIIIDIPIKLSLYTILGNPARTLAVYIHNNPCQNDDDDIINHNLIESMDPIENKDNLDNLLSKLKSDYAPIKIINNEKNIVVEFDTQDQYEKNKAGMQLLALIVLKDYTEPHLISFKKYYHLGKYVTVKFIDQSAMFNYKKAGIDIGSILFFGEIYKLQN